MLEFYSKLIFSVIEKFIATFNFVVRSLLTAVFVNDLVRLL